MILDCSSGLRQMWFDKTYEECVYLDRRLNINGQGLQSRPSVYADSRQLPFREEAFDMVLFDPPHDVWGINSNSGRKYGAWTHTEIINLVFRTSKEISKVVKSNGQVIFKWAEGRIKLNVVLNLLEGLKPIFGHTTTVKGFTHWVCLVKVKV